VSVLALAKTLFHWPRKIRREHYPGVFITFRPTIIEQVACCFPDRTIPQIVQTFEVRELSASCPELLANRYQVLLAGLAYRLMQWMRNV
jgi:hypothetical protein